MPQMAPMSWLMLFSLFSCSFILINIFNFFCPSQIKLNFKNKFLTSNKLNWMW